MRFPMDHTKLFEEAFSSKDENKKSIGLIETILNKYSNLVKEESDIDEIEKPPRSYWEIMAEKERQKLNAKLDAMTKRLDHNYETFSITTRKGRITLPKPLMWEYLSLRTKNFLDDRDDTDFFGDNIWFNNRWNI